MALLSQTMQRNITIFLRAVLLLPLYFSTVPSFCQYFSFEDQNKLFALQEALENHHLQYGEILPLVEERFLRSLSETLDPLGKYLTREEVDALQKLLASNPVLQWETSMTNMDSALFLYRKSLRRSKAILESLTPQNFNSYDTLIMYPYREPIQFAADAEELTTRWIKTLKYQSLSILSKDSSYVVLAENEKIHLLQATMANQADQELCKLTSTIDSLKDLKQLILNKYLQAFAQCFDPHSTFMPIATSEVFNSSLSTHMFSAGISCMQQEDKFIITEVLKSSSAEETGEIRVGDELVGITSAGIMLHPACMDPEAFYNTLYSSEDSTLTVKIKGQRDQAIHTFTLQKRQLKNTFNTIENFFLKVGEFTFHYINLPSFFFSENNEKGMSESIATLLLKARNEAHGVVLDLRNNGGGSILEASNLASIFIDAGPILQASERNKPPYTIKDIVRGKVYQGKIIILVNAISASASEMLASALQYYPNILIVGTPTFGKSTGQDLLPLFESNKLFGYAKITTMGIHQLDGTTYQGAGFIPQVNIPMGMSNQIYGEQNLMYPLSLPVLDKQVTHPEVATATHANLQTASNERIKENKVLREILEVQNKLDSMANSPIRVPLHLNHFQNPYLIFELPKTDQMIQVEETSTTSASNDIVKHNLSSDPILHETLQIFIDWIKL